MFSISRLISRPLIAAISTLRARHPGSNLTGSRTSIAGWNSSPSAPGSGAAAVPSLRSSPCAAARWSWATATAASPPGCSAPIFRFKSTPSTSSPAMLARSASPRGPDAARVHTYCADARAWQPSLGITTSWSPIFSSIASPLGGSFPGRTVARRCFPFGRLGCFGVCNSRGLVWPVRGAAGDRLLYRAFGVLTGLEVRGLPDHHSALSEAGFRFGQRRAWLRGLLVSEIWIWCT